MHGAFRSGTIQANCKEYREQKMYMQVGHLKILRLGWCKWAIVVDAQNWKGFQSVIGSRKELTFGPVQNAHNVIFEPAIHVLLDFMERGLLEGITNPVELINYNRSELPIKKACKEFPLIVKRGPRGLKLIEGVPCGPHKASQHVQHVARAVGLPGGGIHAIRRGSARDYVHLMGRDHTGALLHHHDRTGTTMDNHYTTQKTLPLVQIRLGELTNDLGPVEKAALANTEMMSKAIDVMVRRMQSTDEELGNLIMQKTRYRITAEEEDAIQNFDEIEAITKECQAEWESFVALFRGAREPFTRRFIDAIPRVTGHQTDASPALVEMRTKRLQELAGKLTNARRAAFKRLRNENAKAEASKTAESTTEEREEAQKQLEDPSAIVLKARKAMEEEVQKYLNSNRDVNPVSTAATEEADETEEAEPTTSNQEPLVGKGLPRPAAVPSSDAPKISQLNISLQRLPEVDISEPEEVEATHEPAFEDNKETNVLGIDASVMRAIYIFFLWQDRKAQSITVEPNADGKYVCSECPKFHSRRDDIERYTCGSLGNFNRHMRERHNAWFDVELEAQTDDPKNYRCPGCQTSGFKTSDACLKHCRTTCPASEDYKHLYQALMSRRPTQTKDDLARRDRDKENKLVGEETPFYPNFPAAIRTLQRDLQRTGFVEEWANTPGINLPEDVRQGHEYEDIQQVALQATEVVLDQIYQSGPNDDNPLRPTNTPPSPGPVVAEGSHVLTEFVERSRESMKKAREDSDGESDFNLGSSSEEGESEDEV